MFSWVIWGFLLVDFRVIAVPQSHSLELYSDNQNNKLDNPAADLSEDFDEILTPGFVGCLYSDVCTINERCYNDELFGRCYTEEEMIEANLAGDEIVDEEYLIFLDKILENLWLSKFTWKDLITQCVVKTALLSRKVGEPIDFTSCLPDKDVPKRSEEPIHVHKYTPSLEDVYDANDEDDANNANFNGYADNVDEDEDMLQTLPENVDYEHVAENLPSEENNNDRLESELLEQMQNMANTMKLDTKNHKVEKQREESIEGMKLDKRLFSDGFHLRQSNDRSIDKTCVWLRFLPNIAINNDNAEKILFAVSEKVAAGVKFTDYHLDNMSNEISFRVPEYSTVNSDLIVSKLANGSTQISGYTLETAGFGSPKCRLATENFRPQRSQVVLTVVLCASVLSAVVVVLLLFTIHRHRQKGKKLWTEGAEENPNFFGSNATASKSNSKGIQPVFYGPGSNTQSSADQYKDLCRQRLQSKSVDETTQAFVDNKRKGSGSCSGSPRNSTVLSWTEEIGQSNMDISTGHAILSYMEEHLNAKDKLEAEWQTMCVYEADRSQSLVAKQENNIHKNRYIDALPYDHSRVKLIYPAQDGSDYVNASYIVDHDPKIPAYIVTQGPLSNTVTDFWQMVWEQGSVVIVNLCCLIEGGVPMCHKYWPEEGAQVYGNFEINLVSEHAWCEEYVVRSFYLKNMNSNETRTVTQFHFIAWPDLDVPNSPRSILEFRRKVNKSFRNKASPLVIHCNDGCGRSGTYALLDMILNRLNKGVKEVDVAAALEHIRDQRMDVVKTKEQFEFVLTCIAEEVETLLKVMTT